MRSFPGEGKSFQKYQNRGGGKTKANLTRFQSCVHPCLASFQTETVLETGFARRKITLFRANVQHENIQKVVCNGLPLGSLKKQTNLTPVT